MCEQNKWLKTKDVLADYPISRTQLYKLIHTGKVKAYKLGERGYLFKATDLEAALIIASGEQGW
jgi:excisionase family DNA binding protein